MFNAFGTILDGQVNCDSITSVIDVGDVQYTPPTDNPGTFIPPHPPVFPGDKAIYWIHGMNGSAASWEKAADWVESNYKVVSVRPDYGANQTSWDEAWTGLENKINDNWYNVTKPKVTLYDQSFGICHSLGGVVLRKVSEQGNPEPINGIVTYSSPHGGSRIAQYIEPANNNNITTPEFEELEGHFAYNAGVIASGPISEHLIFGNISYNGTIYSVEDIDLSAFNIGIDKTTEDFIDFIHDFWGFNAVCAVVDLKKPLADGLSKMIFNNKTFLTSFFIKQLTSEAAEVLDPGSSELNISEQITSDGDEKKRVAFTTDITSGHKNAHYSAFKLLYTALKDPNAQSLFSAQTLNDEAVGVFNKIKTFYEDQEIWYEEHYDKKAFTTPRWWPWSLDPLVFWGNLPHLRDEYAIGFQGFTDLNDYYEVIAGARIYEETSSDLGTCYEDEGPVYNVPIQSCESGEWYPNDYSVSIDFIPYDGLLTVDSQKDWNTVDNIPKFNFPGSNHLTIQNDINTQTSLINLLDRNIYGHFFFTEHR